MLRYVVIPSARPVVVDGAVEAIEELLGAFRPEDRRRVVGALLGSENDPYPLWLGTLARRMGPCIVARRLVVRVLEESVLYPRLEPGDPALANGTETPERVRRARARIARDFTLSEAQQLVVLPPSY